MKKCTKCGLTKERKEFHKSAGKKDGLASNCRECRKAHAAIYYNENAERINERNRSKMKSSPDVVRKWGANYRERNRERINAAGAAYRAANPEKRRATTARYREANKEKTRMAVAKWREKNPDAGRIVKQNRRARIAASKGRLSPNIAAKLFGLQNGKCACCGKPLGDDFHLDHIMPIALGGDNEDGNMQLLRAECNLKKNKRHPIDYMRAKGFLL